MATFQCDVCGQSTQINSRWRGSFCQKHWLIAQQVDGGSVLNGRTADTDPYLVDKEIADLKRRCVEACKTV
jgi:hypothetical protein